MGKWPSDLSAIAGHQCEHLCLQTGLTYNPFPLMWRKYVGQSFGVAFDRLSEQNTKDTLWLRDENPTSGGAGVSG